MTMLNTFDIDSDSVMLTMTKVNKDHKSLYHPNKTALANYKREEIDFLLKKAEYQITISKVPADVEFQIENGSCR